MRKRSNIVLNFFVFPFLAILLLYLAFKGIDLDTVWTELLKADYKWILISLVFALGGFFFRALRWRLLLQASNQNPPVQTTFYAVMMAYFVNIAIPRMGELTRCVILKKTNNISIEISFGTVITERIIDLITLLSVIFIVLIFNFSFFSSFFIDNVVKPITSKLNFSPIFLIILIIIFILMNITILFFRKRILELVPTKKIKTFLHGLVKGLFSVFNLKKVCLFFFYTFVLWTCYVLMTYEVFFALPSTSHLTLTDSLFVLSIGGLGMSAPVQNGFGAFHWIVSRGLMLFGISQADGLLYATLCHESQTLMVLILGPITMLMIFLYNKNKKRD